MVDSKLAILNAQFPVGYKKEIQMYDSQADLFVMNKNHAHHGLATRLIHAGNEVGAEFGGVSPAIELSTTYAQAAPGKPPTFEYARCGNPTRSALERNLASMECATYAIAFVSGMGATVTMMNTLKKGDHILCVDDVYGGVQRYLRTILGPNSGIEVSFVDFNLEGELKAAIQPNTKMVWLESPTNPTLKCYDIRAVADIVHANSDAKFVVDNTFFTPVNQNPLLLGADVVFASVTKYIGGHSDVIAGALCMNDRKLYDEVTHIMRTMGTGLSAFSSWLAIRGSKTLEVRVNRAAENAMTVAKWLEAHPRVERVTYPGLPSHPQHEIVKRNMRNPDGGFGGMLSFYIKGDLETSDRFLRALKLIILAESLGGVESLIEHPAIMTHSSVPADQRAKLGIADNFIRMSVGIEHCPDLLEDLKGALAAM